RGEVFEVETGVSRLDVGLDGGLEWSSPKVESLCFDLGNLMKKLQLLLRMRMMINEAVKLVAAGDKDGNVGFWNLDCHNEEEDGELAVHGALDINEKSGIRSVPTYFGTEEEDDDSPYMEEFDEADNVVENDTVTLQSTYLVAHEHDDDNILRTRTNDTQHNELISDDLEKHHRIPFLLF
ncbi:hypothetical protein HID58_051949, partial [Brassica napus]